MWLDGLSLSLILLILKAVAEKLREALLRNLSRRLLPPSFVVSLATIQRSAIAIPLDTQFAVLSFHSLIRVHQIRHSRGESDLTISLWNVTLVATAKLRTS